CPSGKPSSSAFWRKAPGVLLVRLAISATGVLARECCLSSWTCCFVHARRFRRPAVFARLLFFAMRRPSCEERYVSRKIVIANGIGQLFVCSPNHTFTAIVTTTHGYVSTGGPRTKIFEASCKQLDRNAGLT